MAEKYITRGMIAGYAEKLHADEKSAVTIEKYVRDVRAFARFAGEREITKELAISYKQTLQDRGYALSSVNSMLASVNSFLTFCGRMDCKVRLLRVQRRIYQSAEQELSRAEYESLLDAAKRDTRLWLVLQTICATGIRVSELQYFTVEAVRAGEVFVACKNKNRSVLIPEKLRTRLLRYAQERGIDKGIVFRTRGGRALHRSNIWAAMKRLCAQAKINPDKVFPHNLRKLFARTFYQLEHDIAKLADVLGHSNINTTRIYIMTTGTEHRRLMDRLHLLADGVT